MEVMGSVGRQFVGNPESAERYDGEANRLGVGGGSRVSVARRCERGRERRRVSPVAVGAEEKRVTRPLDGGEAAEKGGGSVVGGG